MTFLTRDILSFYKPTKENFSYFKKHFSNSKNPGFCEPMAEDPYKFKGKDKKEHTGIIDEHNTYKINSLGLRGKVYESPEIVASGCSITFGIGVPEEGRWTNFLSKKINKDILNLGNTGASVQTICTDLIQYCMNNKMPKEIFCLMPDFFRNMIIVDKDFYKSKMHRTDLEKNESLGYTFSTPEINMGKNSIFMNIKDKKYTEDSVSPHQLILNSINFIYILESFCLSNNIKLYWTTWDLPSATILQELSKSGDFKLKNFTPLFPPNELLGFNSYINTKCDLDHGSEFRTDKSWPQGSDYSVRNNKKQKAWSHPGIHFQYHISEFFYDIIS